MQQTIFGGLLLVGLAAFSISPNGADSLFAQTQISAADKDATLEDPSADAAWAGCINAATRRCVLDQALRIVGYAKEPANRALRVQQFNALLSIGEAQAAIGLSNDAVATFAQLRKLAESLETELVQPLSYFPFVNLAKAMARAGMARQARETALSFKDEVVRELSLQSIAEVQARAGMIQEARETAPSLKDDIALLDVLLAITQLQARAGLIDEARTTAQSIAIDSYRAEALASIGEAEAKAGRAKQAIEAFSLAIALAQGRKYDSVFVSIAGAQARAGLNDDAHRTVQSIENAAARAEALASIAEAEARAASPAKQATKETFDRAIKTAQSITDRSGLRSEALSGIAIAMAGAGLFQEALQTAETIDYRRSETIDSIAVAMAEAGRIADAIKTAQSFAYLLERARTLARIAIVLQK
jgi:tetratricopeptide (TPR) repeat protein